MKMFLKHTATLLSITLIMASCGGNGTPKETKTTDSVTNTDAVPAPTEEPAPSGPIAPTADCMMSASLGARNWKASGVTVNQINEHLTISHDGDYTDSTDIHNLQIMIHNYKGPGTYKFTGDGNCTFSVGLTQTDTYLTAHEGSAGTITVTEQKDNTFKANFSFKGANNDGTPKFLEVTKGIISAKDGGNCRVQGVVNK